MPTMPAETGTFVLTGYPVILHKTHVGSPAYDICAVVPAGAQGFDITCSLVCYLGAPYISGVIMYRMYRETCSGGTADTFLYSPSEFTIPVGCSPTYNENSMNNDTWVGNTTAVTSHGTAGYGYKIKMDATLQAVYVPPAGGSPASNYLIVTVTTSRLMPGTLLWAVCNTQSMTLTETAASAAGDGYFSRQYESAITATTFDGTNCSDEVKYVKATVTLMSYRFGCSTSYGSSEKCALRTIRAGITRSYSCLVCLITPATRYAWTPQVAQMGVNAPGCGYGSRCACWEWDGITLNPPDIYPSDLLNVGCPNESPSSNIQQIQYGYGGTNSYGHSYEVLLKTINRTGAMCVAARIFGGSWVVGTLSIIQAVDPFIMKADFTGLVEDNPVFQFYGMEFPTNAVAECESNYESAVAATEPQQESPVKKMMAKMSLTQTNPCVHLGQQLETTPSCGCSGGNLHECAKHGKCRVQGNTIEMNCWRCPDYIDRTENNGMIEENNGG
jgi:hypothetical protein